MEKTIYNGKFILNDKGWRLSPLYDVNPVPYGDVLSLNIDSYDNSISIDLAISSACYYDINECDAEAYADEILTMVKNNWEQLAKKYGINRFIITFVDKSCSYGCFISYKVSHN